MRNVKRPGFVDSPYFVPEQDNWHLLPDAPDAVKKEFEEFIEEQKEQNEKGVFL